MTYRAGTCIAPHRHDPDRPRGAVDGLLLCRGCLERLRWTIAEFPAQLAALRQAVAISGGRGEPVSGSGSDGVPIKVGVVDLEVEIADVLASWVRLVAGDRGHVPPRTRDVHRLAAWLGQHVEWVAAQPFADEVLAELTDLARRAKAATTPRREQRRFPLARKCCPDCATALWVERGPESTLVACEGSPRHEWEARQFARLGRRLRAANERESA